MYHTFLIKYGEIGLKGKNRHVFEDALAKQVRLKLEHIEGDYTIRKERGRIYVECGGDWNEEETVDALRHVFGIVGICPVHIYELSDIDAMRKDIVDYIRSEHPGSSASFKVKARRVNKSFPLTSMEVDAALGEAILEAFPSMHVDVHQPEILFDLEIRDRVYVYSKVLPGPGGMPVGSNGSAMLCLSGGIDSPVAGRGRSRRWWTWRKKWQLMRDRSVCMLSILRTYSWRSMTTVPMRSSRLLCADI